jgi:hypothetical protein
MRETINISEKENLNNIQTETLVHYCDIANDIWAGVLSDMPNEPKELDKVDLKDLKSILPQDNNLN